MTTEAIKPPFPQIDPAKKYTENEYNSMLSKMGAWVYFMVHKIAKENDQKHPLSKHIGNWYCEYGEIESISFHPFVDIFDENLLYMGSESEVEAYLNEHYTEHALVEMVTNDGKNRRDIIAEYYINKNKIGYLRINELKTT